MKGTMRFLRIKTLPKGIPLQPANLLRRKIDVLAF